MVDKNDSQDTLANDDDAHKAVLCALSLILCDSLLFFYVNGLSLTQFHLQMPQ